MIRVLMTRATRARSGSQPVVDIGAALRHLRRVEGPMSELIRRHGPPELRRTRNSFASLGRAIIYQQLSGKAAGTIYQRFLGLYPTGRFPSPKAVLASSVEDLRSAGISRSKASYLLDLAAKFDDGTVKSKRLSVMDDQAIAEMLCQVKGIGQWSVDMFLILGLLRPDVLPVGDLGVRKGVQQYFGLSELPAANVMESCTEPWRPYRSIGSWYMWRLVEEKEP